jgi:glycosyltransferase involved in cell wall biosynthesis
MLSVKLLNNGQGYERSMKIAFVTLGFAPVRTSGLDISGERLVKCLLEAGHEVSVIAVGYPGLKETYHHPGLKIYRLEMGLSNWIGYAYRAVKQLKKLQQNQVFDVIHFWDVHFAYSFKGKYIASLHQSFQQRRESIQSSLFKTTYYSLSERFAERPALRNASGLLAVSKSTRDSFILHYGIPAEKIQLARHGIDTEFFKPSPIEGFVLRKTLGIGDEEAVILFAGFVTPRKGLDFLAKALSKIQPIPRLVIIGKWQESYRDSFYQLIGPYKDRIIAPGMVPDELLPAYYSLADIFVSPSLLEGFGLPLAEALACETPVVATRAGSIPEVVGPGGIFVAAGDPNELANAITHLIHDREARHIMGVEGRIYIQNEFSLNSMLRSTLACYSQQINAPDKHSK